MEHEIETERNGEGREDIPIGTKNNASKDTEKGVSEDLEENESLSEENQVLRTEEPRETESFGARVTKKTEKNEASSR